MTVDPNAVVFNLLDKLFGLTNRDLETWSNRCSTACRTSDRMGPSRRCRTARRPRVSGRSTVG